MANIFVDFGATNDGDGTSYAQASSAGGVGAFKTIVGKAFAAVDLVWIRRSATALTLAAQYAPAIPGVRLIGWPIAGDSNFASRPVAAQAAWDGDAAQYAKIIGGATTTQNFAPTGIASSFHRIHMESSLTGSQAHSLFTFTQADIFCENLKATYTLAVVASSGSAIDLRCFSSTGTNPKIIGLYCRGATSGVVGISTGCVVVSSGASYGYVSDVVIDLAYGARGAYSLSGGALLLSNTAGAKSLVAENITINFLGGLSITQSTAIMLGGGSVRVQDITINAQPGSSFEGPGCVMVCSDSQILNMQCTGNMGCIYIAGSGNTFEAKNYHILYPMASASTAYITGGVGAPLMLATAAAHVANTAILTNCTLTVASSGAAKIWDAGSDCVALLNNVDYANNSFTRGGVGQAQMDYEIFSMNHSKILGAWRYENRHGALDTSNTYRSTGSNFSLRGLITEPAPFHNRRALPISVKGRESIYINLAAGDNTITLYGAHKNYAGAVPTKMDIGMAFDWLDNAGVFKFTSTFTKAALEADASTWNNDPGITPFKVSVTIAAAAAQTVPLNIFASPDYDISGYFYIDPAPVVS